MNFSRKSLRVILIALQRYKERLEKDVAENSADENIVAELDNDICHVDAIKASINSELTSRKRTSQ